jgi:hypothetical protein
MCLGYFLTGIFGCQFVLYPVFDGSSLGIAGIEEFTVGQVGMVLVTFGQVVSTLT